MESEQIVSGTERSEQAYIASLSEKERLGHIIAQEMLGSSYCVVKSVGFLRWKSKL